MNLKEEITKILYKNSFDGDSNHSYILFENMNKIIEEQENVCKRYADLKKLDYKYQGAEEVLCILMSRGTIKMSESNTLLDKIENEIIELLEEQNKE